MYSVDVISASVLDCGDEFRWKSSSSDLSSTPLVTILSGSASRPVKAAGNGRRKMLSSNVNICKTKIIPKKTTRYQKHQFQFCDCVIYPAATGPMYDPVPRANANQLNFVPRSCAKNMSVVDIWTKESTGAAPKPVKMLTM